MRPLLFSLLLLVSGPAHLFAQGLATIRPGDIFEMRLGGMDSIFAQDFNGQYSVSQEGRVNIPLLGEVPAVGMTPPQLQTVIQNRFKAEKIFTSPSVNINLMQASRSITIGGGVKAAQRMQWTPDLTLNQAIDIAGLSEWGSKKGVRLVREGKVQIFDARKFEKDPSLDPKLLPGDQITVPGQ